MNKLTLSIGALDKYELTQPTWLWLIPLFLFINITLFVYRRYFEKTKPAHLTETSTEQTFIHPLLNLLQTRKYNSYVTSHFNFFYFISFVFIAVALAQPVKIGKKLPEPPQERDITFIVDTSVSMVLRDYILEGKRIDRMSLLKGILSNFIDKFNGEKMSIIVFGDNAYTLVPLTSDQYLLQKMLSRVQATMAGRFNAIGDAIALAVKQAVEHNKLDDIERKRILVLLTDADQPTGTIDPIIAAKIAKKENIPLYTIAIGATSLAAEESRKGGLLYSPVDLDLLKKLSSITGAKNYHAGNPNALKQAIEDINLNETNKSDIQPLFYRQSLYFWFLIAAFLILSIYQLAGIFNSTIFENRTSKS